MKVQIIKTEWFLDESRKGGTVTFKTDKGILLEAFSDNQNFQISEIVDVELSILDDDFKWEQSFSRNNKQETKLEKADRDWEYNAFGQIKSVNPVIVDFGAIELEVGDWTNDINVINEFIYLKIDRLDILRC